MTDTRADYFLSFSSVVEAGGLVSAFRTLAENYAVGRLAVRLPRAL